MNRILTLVALLALAAGCARTPPAQYYLLQAPAATTVGTASGPRIGLGPVRLPEYLDRPQIVSWASATRLELSNSHRWAEPLQQSVARALLDGAIAYARKQKVKVLEAYPIDKAGPSVPMSMWFGAASMFRHAGFVEVARRKPERPVMRLALSR